MNNLDSTVLENLFQLESVSGKNDKLEILKLSDNSTIEFIRWCLDPNVNFYITKVPKVTSKTVPHPTVQNIDDAYYALLDKVASRFLTGKAAATFVESIAASLGSEGNELLKRLLKRDPRCGVGVKTLNTAVGYDLIYVPGYMRCSPFNAKTVAKMGLPVISQTKMDGLFVNIIVDEESNSVTVLTRSGQDITDKVLASHPRSLLSLVVGIDSSFVLHGEAVASYDGDINNLMPREASNGYLNSDDVDPDRVHFFLWDTLPLDEFFEGKCDIPYTERFAEVHDTIQAFQRTDYADESLVNRFFPVSSRELNSVDEIIAHFKEVRAKGEEGTIIKSPDGIWKNGTSKDQIKLKVIFDCDLMVSDAVEGEGKYAGMLGALTVSSSCGQVVLNIGTGFSDIQRQYLWEHRDELIDSIVAVKANDITVTKRDEDGNPIEHALFLPRFIEFREDKYEADDIERIREQVIAFTDTLKLLEE